MHLNDALIFLHLTGVVLLAGAVGVEVIVLAAASRASTVANAQFATFPGRFIGPVFPASAVLILGSGLWLAGRLDIFGDAWVIGAIVLFVVTAALGMGVHGKRMEHAGRLAAKAQPGPCGPELTAALRDPVMHTSSMVSLGFFAVFLYLMSSQPGVLGTIVSIVVGAVVGALGAQLMLRRGGQPAGVTPLSSDVPA